METNVIFRKLEVIGETKDVTVNSLKENAGFVGMVDATGAYAKWRQTASDVSEASVKEWMKEYLKAKKYNKAGLGAYIVTQKGVSDTRKRPYKETLIKHDSKTHTPERFYVLRDTNGNVLDKFKKSADARTAAKDLVTDLREDVHIFNEWVAKEGNSEYAVVSYVPSKGTQNCIVTAFGYVDAE